MVKRTLEVVWYQLICNCIYTYTCVCVCDISQAGPTKTKKRFFIAKSWRLSLAKRTSAFCWFCSQLVCVCVRVSMKRCIYIYISEKIDPCQALSRMNFRWQWIPGWSEELEGNSERLAFECGWYMTKAQPYSIKQFSVASFTKFRETSY